MYYGIWNVEVEGAWERCSHADQCLNYFYNLHRARKRGSALGKGRSRTEQGLVDQRDILIFRAHSSSVQAHHRPFPDTTDVSVTNLRPTLRWSWGPQCILGAPPPSRAPRLTGLPEECASDHLPLPFPYGSCPQSSSAHRRDREKRAIIIIVETCARS